jgi:hypothetical protein
VINLIPKEEKKKMKIDFRFRLALLFLVMFDFCIFIVCVSILPSYFISSAKDSLVNAKLETQKSQPLPLLGEESLAAVKDINSKLILVENAEKNQFLPSNKVINAILLKKRSDIKITQILYENDSIKGKTISITGTAPSREVLLLFRLELEDNPVFRNVNLPISNFVKGSDIQFSLSLIPA